MWLVCVCVCVNVKAAFSRRRQLSSHTEERTSKLWSFTGLPCINKLVNAVMPLVSLFCGRTSVLTALGSLWEVKEALFTNLTKVPPRPR